MGRANVSVIQDSEGVVVEVFLDPDKAQARLVVLNEGEGGYTLAASVLSDPDNLG